MQISTEANNHNKNVATDKKNILRKTDLKLKWLEQVKVAGWIILCVLIFFWISFLEEGTVPSPPSPPHPTPLPIPLFLLSREKKARLTKPCNYIHHHVCF